MYGFLMFDLDGTLVDSRKDIALSVNLTLDEFNLPHRPPEVIYGFIGGGMHNLIRRSLPDGMEALVDKGVDVFWEIYREHVLDTTRLYPGIKEMLERLSAGHRLAVVTNKPNAHMLLILKGLGIAGHFVTAHGWKMGLPVKPDPTLLRMAMEDAGARAEDTLLIGDSTNDVLAAKAAGIKCCAVGYGYGMKEKNLAAGADLIADEVEDIVRLLG